MAHMGRRGGVAPRVKENVVCIVGLVELNVCDQDRLYAFGLCLSE